MSQHTTPSGHDPIPDAVDFSERFGPQADAALEAGNASALIRDAMAAALETHADLVAQPDCETPAPPAPVYDHGELGAPRFCRCDEVLRDDFATLVEQGYGRSFAHGIRRAVRDHLEVHVDGNQ